MNTSNSFASLVVTADLHPASAVFSSRDGGGAEGTAEALVVACESNIRKESSERAALAALSQISADLRKQNYSTAEYSLKVLPQIELTKEWRIVH